MRKLGRAYPEQRFDARGQLKAPRWFYPIALLLTQSLWIFLMAAVSRQQGAALLSLFYPKPSQLYWHLAAALPALLALFAAGGDYRARWPYRAWLRQQSRGLLTSSALAHGALLVWQLKASDWHFSWPSALNLLATLWALDYVRKSQQLRDYSRESLLTSPAYKPAA
ncbi:MAG: DUF2919 family protein [Aeromonas sp.]